MTLLRQSALLAALSLVMACGSTQHAGPPDEPARSGTLQILVFTAERGAQHQTLPAVTALFQELPASENIQAIISADADRFSDAGLKRFDAVVFANTSGSVLNEGQENALRRYIQRGHGFVGVHAAADTQLGSNWYAALVGAQALREATAGSWTLGFEENTHASALNLPATFELAAGSYEFDRSPRQRAAVVLKVVAPLAAEGEDKPVSWYHQFDGGRSFYTSLGHASETWQDPNFRAHLLGGVRWAARGSGFGRAVLTRAMQSPIALAVRPDDDIYFIERTGEVRILRAKSGKVDVALALEVDTAQENGLLGLALDPAFAKEPFVYLYYSAPIAETSADQGPAGRNVLTRFTARADGTLDASSRVVLLEVPSERRCCHEGGALTFAADGTLWISTGDNTNPFDSNGTAPIDRRPGRETFNAERTAANPFDLRGKILRINRDGSIPDGNLFPTTGELGRPEIYSMGVRNPYRLAADPLDGRVFFSDIGPDASSDSTRGPRGYDEVNLAVPGNYGWPHCIGEGLPYSNVDFGTGSIGAPFDCAASVMPVLAYDYGTMTYPALGRGILPDGTFIGRAAIAGAVYRSGGDARAAWPARFQGQLLMADWTRSLIAAVQVDAAGRAARVERVLSSEMFRRPIDLEVGADGSLYVLEYGSSFWGNNPDAQLSRIEYAPFGSLEPIAELSASALIAPVGRVVHFSGSTSRALSPNETIVDYAWDFDGDGQADVHAKELDHRFTKAGAYTVSLVVTSSTGKRSRPRAESVVIGNSPPSARILEPARGTRLTRGSEIVLRGEASDPEDGAAKCSELTWKISLVHNTHAHPLTTLVGCEARFVPDLGEHQGEGLLAYAVELVYTDHGGPAGEPPLSASEGIQYDLDVLQR
ncbi:MAG: ThuA domain-containing protein [Myxococcota bacterium]